jgi:hypothetical protein
VAVLNKRQFERLKLTEDAFATTDARRLGKISQAGGGGMLIRSVPQPELAMLQVGRKLRIEIVEPKASTTHTIDVLVRYHHGDSVGVQFVTGDDAEEDA